MVVEIPSLCLKGKKGWLRILEATIAIMIIGSVLLVMYSRGAERQDLTEYMYDLQKEVLMTVVQDDDLRQAALNGDENSLNEFAGTRIPPAFNYTVRVCELGDVCTMGFYVDKDVYADSVVIASALIEYDPKKVVLFVWEA